MQYVRKVWYFRRPLALHARCAFHLSAAALSGTVSQASTQIEKPLMQQLPTEQRRQPETTSHAVKLHRMERAGVCIAPIGLAAMAFRFDGLRL